MPATEPAFGDTRSLAGLALMPLAMSKVPDLRVNTPLRDTLMRAAILALLKPSPTALLNRALMPCTQITSHPPRCLTPIDLALMIRAKIARPNKQPRARVRPTPMLGAVLRGCIAPPGTPLNLARVRVAVPIALLGARGATPDDLARVLTAVVRGTRLGPIAATPAALVASAVSLAAALLSAVDAPSHIALVLAAVMTRHRDRAVAKRGLAARTTNDAR
ncbi:hypothetical protein ABKA04_009338 [Annulohypoxylon sp. FPYF3050]